MKRVINLNIGESNMAENDFGIAIIGMAGRFPQADTVQAFWENLLASRVHFLLQR